MLTIYRCLFCHIRYTSKTLNPITMKASTLSSYITIAYYFDAIVIFGHFVAITAMINIVITFQFYCIHFPINSMFSF